MSTEEITSQEKIFRCCYTNRGNCRHSERNGEQRMNRTGIQASRAHTQNLSGHRNLKNPPNFFIGLYKDLSSTSQPQDTHLNSQLITVLLRRRTYSWSFKLTPRLGLCANIHALTKLSEGGGLVLVPPVTKPALDLSHIPVQLL